VGSLGLPGYDTCKGKDCKRTAKGRILKFNRCVAVGNFASNTPVHARISVTSTKDGKHPLQRLCCSSW
jgi:hypothetical protein